MGEFRAAVGEDLAL